MGDPLEEAEYLHWEARQRDKHELHHGFIVAFAGGTIDHDAISFNVRTALKNAYATCKTFGPDVKVRISNTTFFYADAGVHDEAMSGQELSIAKPVVVCEVLSERTRAYDLVEKRAAYRSLPSLEMYITVHTQIRRIEVDTRGNGAEWRTSIVDEGELPVGNGEIPLDDIYDSTWLCTGSRG